MKLLSIALLFLFLNKLTAQDTSKTYAKLDLANIYYGYGAELTHSCNSNVTAKTKTIVVSNLSLAANINSLQISVPENVSLLSYQYNIVFVNTNPIIIIKNLNEKPVQDSIKKINIENRRFQNLINIESSILEKTNLLIEKNISLMQTKNNTISNDEIIKIINFNNLKIEQINKNIFEYQLKMEDNLQLITDITIRNTLQPSTVPVDNQKQIGQLTLQVLCKSTENIPIGISYFTNNAGWTPNYDLRVSSKNNKLKLVYKASVVQTTGIDWKNVKLSLSTGTANIGGVAPLLNPMLIQFYAPQIYKKMQTPLMYNTIQSADMEVALQGNASGLKVNQKNDIDNSSTVQNSLTQNQGLLNTVYEIDLPYDILSNGQIYSVAIKNIEIDANLKNYAVPKLDKEAFLLAEVADWEFLDLMYAEANIIMDNIYLGKTIIDPNSDLDTLNLSLGHDKRVFVKRNIVKEKTNTKVNNGETKNTITYELVVKNNKSTHIDLILKDQYPISNDKDVVIKLESNDDAMVNKETGILTWKIKLASGESKKVRFTYTTKAPKDKKIYNFK